MDIININRETCTKCGICAIACGRRLIDFNSHDYPKPHNVAESECIICGHCVAACPTGSLTHREIPIEKCPPVQKDLAITAAQCEHFIMSRRSTKAFVNKAVPRDTITRLISIARHAPTGHNSQNVSWLVIDSKDELSRLRRIGVDWLRMVVKNAPDELTAANYKRMLIREENGESVLLRDAPVIIMTHADKSDAAGSINCVIAISYLELAAKGLGLGCCWSGYLYYMAASYPPMQKALILPDKHRIYGCVMIGHPKINYQRIPLRNPPRITWQ